MASSVSAERPPYLTLTFSQALSLPPPSAPEPEQHDSVNSMLDTRARHMPDQLAVGFTYLACDREWKRHSLSYYQVCRLSTNLAGELKKRLPARQTNAKTPNKTALVAILSPSGVELFGHIVALWRLGYGVLCIAPGSPAESIANLLRLTETRTVLAHASQTKTASDAIDIIRGDGKEANIKAQVCKMLPDILSYVHSSNDSKSKIEESVAGAEDVLVTMHTSGSSGLPKPVYQLHRFWTASMLSASGRELSAFTTTPLFHGGMSDLLRSIQAGSSIFFHPTADPGALSASAICQALRECKQSISYFLSVPYILDMLFTDRSDEARRMLASMLLVSTGGALLPQQLGDGMVRERIKLVSRLGSSECGFLMSSWRDFESDTEWNCLRIPDELGQGMLRFEPYGPSAKEALYELVVTKHWPTKLIANRNDGSYATSDLYAKHDALPNAWRYDSRSDDTIVLVSGQKATALLAEQKLKASPFVGEAIVFGVNRDILGALVFVTGEVVPEGSGLNDSLRMKLLRELQPVLSRINVSSPRHAQLATEMVYLLPPSEASHIPRASKGTLQRGRAYQHYSNLIDSMYTDFEQGRSLRLDSNNGEKGTLGGEDLIAWLGSRVESINGTSVSPDTDLFVTGVDSIQSARIRAAIHQNIDTGGRLLERNVVYEYPTLRLLSQHIEEVRAGADREGEGDRRKQRELKLMRDLVDKYSVDQNKILEASKTAEADDDMTKAEDQGFKATLYILTGVTGGLGAQILDQVLVQAGPEDVVVCLVRAKGQYHARQRVLDSLESRQLDKARTLVQAGHFQVQCLAADLSRSDCGVSFTDLSRLVQHRNVVTVHSAWSVNFVAGLSSFETENIAGLAHLLDLHDALIPSCKSSQTSSFTFCSSVASILGSESVQACKVAKETVSTSPEDAVAMGYARSKWVAEQLVARRLQVDSRYMIVRIGQLGPDTVHGVWNGSEAWPILIRLSQQLGRFPDLKRERLDWMSTDVAANIVLDLASLNASPSGNVEVYNVAQPTTVSKGGTTAKWLDLFYWLITSGMNLELISASDWLDAVRSSNVDHRGLLSLWQKNFTSVSVPDSENILDKHLQFSCKGALDASRRFRSWQDEGVTQQLVQNTVQRWKSIGFLK